MSHESGLQSLVDSYLDLWWHLDPVAATWAGAPNHDHLLGRFGAEEMGEHLAALQALGNGLEELAVEDLDDEIDRTALLNMIRVAQHQFGEEEPHLHSPQFWVEHLVDGLGLLLHRSDRPAPDRAWAAAHRLDAVPEFLESAEQTLADCPSVFVHTAMDILDHCDELITQLQVHLDPESVEGFEGACARATEALRNFGNFLEGLEDSNSASTFAIGEDAFDFRLSFQHALPDTAEHLWNYGSALVDEVRQEVADCAHRIDPTAPWPDTVDRLRAEHPAPHEIVEAYAAEMERSRVFIQENKLLHVPEGALDVVETPPYLRPLVPFAAYQPPGAFSDDQRGIFYVSPPDDHVDIGLYHCTHEIALTALHEGYPGHHLHFLSMHAQPRPLRRLMQTPLTCEGWALYCEELMGENDFYRTEEERLFQRLGLLWRALRIVVDVGLHTRDLSIKDAVQLMVDNVRIDESSAMREVARCCAMPTYNSCYALGRRELLALRRDVQTITGDDFSLCDFHRRVLGLGGMPIGLMRWSWGV